MLELSLALEAFVRGFSQTKSFQHPYEASKHGAIWVLRDAPGNRRQRLAEMATISADPKAIRKLASKLDTGRYAVGYLTPEGDDPGVPKQHYKANCFRLTGSEQLFTAEPQKLKHDEAITVRRVENAADAALVNKVARRRQILDRHLMGDDPDVRLYASFADGTAVGWVRSVKALPGANWVSNLWVTNELRRKGIGSELMRALLADDARHGVQHSVLLASIAGAKLYPTLGYERLGLLQIFMPPRAKGTRSGDR